MSDRTLTSEKPQVVERVAKILGVVSVRGGAGARLKDIAIDTGIARPTVHRLLGELAAVGYVLQRDDKRYTLGPALFSLGLSAPSPIRDLDSIRRLAQGLADHCGDVVYVSLRKYGGVHYLLRAEGNFPIRTHLVSETHSKPFTASYSGLALLALMGEDEQRSAINKLALDAPPEWVEAHRRQLERTIREKIDEVLALGYCSGKNIVMPGVSGMAAPIPSRTRPPYMALSISAVEERLSPERVLELVPHLLRTANDISAFID
jgi:DNA-binding IclR family transcriptional regulator